MGEQRCKQEQEGLISAYLLDGQGGGSPLDWAGVEAHWEDEAFVWVHLDYTQPRARQWLRQRSGLDETTCDALLSEETRPRSEAVGDGLFVILRGVNLNPKAEPDDMVSLRLWIEQNRLITLRQHRFMAVEEVRESLKAGRGPHEAMGILVAMAERLVFHAGGVITRLDEELDSLEEAVIDQEPRPLRTRLAETRRVAIGIRRFLAPQREAMTRLMNEPVSWIQNRARRRLGEIADRVTRYVEDLDSIRDRAAVTQEELSSRLSEHTNRTMYILSVVAGIFMPLGLLTGLLGINVGGMPGVESGWAFWIVCLVLVAIAIVEIILLRRNRWL